MQEKSSLVSGHHIMHIFHFKWDPGNVLKLVSLFLTTLIILILTALIILILPCDRWRNVRISILIVGTASHSSYNVILRSSMQQCIENNGTYMYVWVWNIYVCGTCMHVCVGMCTQVKEGASILRGLRWKGSINLIFHSSNAFVWLVVCLFKEKVEKGSFDKYFKNQKKEKKSCSDAQWARSAPGPRHFSLKSFSNQALFKEKCNINTETLPVGGGRTIWNSASNICSAFHL